MNVNESCSLAVLLASLLIYFNVVQYKKAKYCIFGSKHLYRTAKRNVFMQVSIPSAMLVMVSLLSQSRSLLTCILTCIYKIDT